MAFHWLDLDYRGILNLYQSWLASTFELRSVQKATLCVRSKHQATLTDPLFSIEFASKTEPISWSEFLLSREIVEKPWTSDVHWPQRLSSSHLSIPLMLMEDNGFSLTNKSINYARMPFGCWRTYTYLRFLEVLCECSVCLTPFVWAKDDCEASIRATSHVIRLEHCRYSQGIFSSTKNFLSDVFISIKIFTEDGCRESLSFTIGHKFSVSLSCRRWSRSFCNISLYLVMETVSQKRETSQRPFQSVEWTRMNHTVISRTPIDNEEHEYLLHQIDY